MIPCILGVRIVVEKRSSIGLVRGMTVFAFQTDSERHGGDVYLGTSNVHPLGETAMLFHSRLANNTLPLAFSLTGKVPLNCQ